MRLIIQPDGGKTIKQLLDGTENFIPNVCGGHGRCGKCAVKVISGNVPVTQTDREFFSKDRLDAGMRLACCAIPVSDCEIEVPKSGAEPEILVDFAEGKAETGIWENVTADGAEAGVLKNVTAGGAEAGILENPAGDVAGLPVNTGADEDTSISIIIDLGTTTIGMLAYDRCGRRLGTEAFRNPQAAYGADVVSRITACTEGDAAALKAAITQAVSAGLERLINKAVNRNENQEKPEFAEAAGERKDREIKPDYIILAGNTTMIHLLMGWDCDGLASYPFKPHSLERVEGPAREYFGNICGDALLVIFPGISAFVGGDVVAGMYGLGFDGLNIITEENGGSEKSERIGEIKETGKKLLMDLGTNGEMVCTAANGFLAASAAAGPAFEGSSLSCGSRALEVVAQLLRDGIIDSTGCLADGYEFGYPLEGFEETQLTTAEYSDGVRLRNVLTQQDIRDLQLAKGAVRAAAECLLDAAKRENSEVPRISSDTEKHENSEVPKISSDAAKRENSEVPKISSDTEKHESSERLQILLAGGMGQGLNIEKVKETGLFPENAEIIPVGNSCLAGLTRYLKECYNGQKDEADKIIGRLVERTKTIELTTDVEFSAGFIYYMNF